jgi:hypothetical protein
MRDDDDDFDDFDEPEDDDSDETMPCPHCGESVYDDAERCPSCGWYLSREDAPRRFPWWFVVGFLLCMVVLMRWVMGR